LVCEILRKFNIKSL